jgi:hypothetical protein
MGELKLNDEKPNMVPAGEFIVGALLHAGVVKPEDAELAVKIVEEELTVWLAIKNFDGAAAKKGGKVPFMITQAQREAVRQKGFEDDQIADMTPEKAHGLLGLVK